MAGPWRINPARAAAFVRAHARLGPVPGIPELRLHLADDLFGLWTRTEAEAGRRGIPPPYWAFAWAGGQALARYLLDHPELVEGRRVLDVAAGSGLVAIAAARAGAADVTASDVDPLAAAAIALNAAANGVTVSVLPRDVLTGDGSPADVVLAGDAFYEQPLAARIIAFLERAQARGAVVLAGDPGRAYLPRRRVQAVASYDVPVSPALEDTPVKRVTVWRLVRPGRPGRRAPRGPAAPPGGPRPGRG